MISFGFENIGIFRKMFIVQAQSTHVGLHAPKLPFLRKD